MRLAAQNASGTKAPAHSKEGTARKVMDMKVFLDLEQGGFLAIAPALSKIGDKPASAYIVFPSEQVVSLTVGEVALLILKLRDCQRQAQRELIQTSYQEYIERRALARSVRQNGQIGKSF